jgi:hypothetical protein
MSTAFRRFLPLMEKTEYTVTYRSTDRQRLRKHIPAGAKERNNMTSIARQRISKQASLKIEAVFSAWSVRSGYKEVLSSVERAKCRVSGLQPAGI